MKNFKKIFYYFIPFDFIYLILLIITFYKFVKPGEYNLLVGAMTTISVMSNFIISRKIRKLLLICSIMLIFTGILFLLKLFIFGGIFLSISAKIRLTFYAALSILAGLMLRLSQSPRLSLALSSITLIRLGILLGSLGLLRMALVHGDESSDLFALSIIKSDLLIMAAVSFALGLMLRGDRSWLFTLTAGSPRSQRGWMLIPMAMLPIAFSLVMMNISGFHQGDGGIFAFLTIQCSVACICVMHCAALRTDFKVQAAAMLSANVSNRVSADIDSKAGQAALSEFSAYLTHELAQPLTVTGNANYALRKILENKSCEPDAAVIAGASIMAVIAHNASALSAEILATLRSFFRTGEVAAAPESLSLIVNAALRLATNRRPATAFVFNVDVASDVDEIFVDKEKLQIVFYNLFSNALHAMQNQNKPGQLTLTAVLSEGEALICVTDTGPGIPPELLDGLFSPVRSATPGGMGLGLSLCRRFIEAHGGKIWLDSSETVGAKFFLKLPLANAQDLNV